MRMKCMKTNLLTIITTISIMITFLSRKVNLIMFLGILAALVMHVSFNWLIDMVIIIVIINIKIMTRYGGW